MAKVLYELDPHNKWKFRSVIDGRFKLNKKNELSYHVKSPVSKEVIPHQIKLRGRWSLTDDHKLQLTLDKKGRKTFTDKITLEGRILDVKSNSLLFAVTAKTKNKKSIYALNLRGSWKADKYNRLTFHVKKEYGGPDILIFKGAWEVNKNHQLIYRYEKKHTLTFKGHWDIKKKMRLSYLLEGRTDSFFDFKVRGGIFKEGYIKYELGIALGRRIKPVKRVVKLSGRWKIKRNKGLLFEVEYENKKLHAIIFGIEAKLSSKDTVSFKLKNNVTSKDIGGSLELSRKILKGKARSYLKLLKSKKESSVFIGAACRW